MQGPCLCKEPRQEEAPDQAGQGLAVCQRGDAHPGAGRSHQPEDCGGRKEEAPLRLFTFSL